MNTNNVYNQLIRIIDNQAQQNNQGVDLVLKYYEKHERMHKFVSKLFVMYADKNNRTEFEETCYQELHQLLSE